MTLSTQSTAHEFEQLVQLILKANLFQFQVTHSQHPDEFDFRATMDNEVWAIEVKFYRTARPQVSLLESAAARLASQAISVGYRKAMLVVSCYLSSALLSALEEKFSLSFIDRSELLNMAAKTPKLLDELNSLLESDPTISPEPFARSDKRTPLGKPLPKSPPPKDTNGTKLCDELKALKRGRGTWSVYEALCDRILKYLFPNDLHGWHRQKRTDDGLNRFDYVCRIRPTTDFWQFLVHHLDSRYILFEFKNYSGKIKQGQILTTEKYLLEHGLRRVAIVMSRVGAEEDAIKMTQGAMREQGKLMLVLNDEQVCEMLHMKERGEDPTDRLFEIADDFLLSLPR